MANDPLTDADLERMTANGAAIHAIWPHLAAGYDVLRLVAEVRRLQAHARDLADRLAAASECLGRAAERRDREPERAALRRLAGAAIAAECGCAATRDGYCAGCVCRLLAAAVEARRVLGE